MKLDIREGADVILKTVVDLTVEKTRLVDDILFEGLDVLRCYEGRFRFSFKDRPAILLEPGEVLVTYPRHTMTIDALDTQNRIVYGTFSGRDVEAYFDSFGFFDCAKGRTAPHYDSLMELRRRIAAAMDYLPFLARVLVTQADEMRKSGRTLLFDAMRHVHVNVKAGKAQVKFLCESLGISRMHLTRIFAEAGLGTPADFIRRRQMHHLRDFIEHTELPFKTVAERTGFLSTAHFSTFVKRMTGATPTQLRRGGVSVS